MAKELLFSGTPEYYFIGRYFFGSDDEGMCCVALQFAAAPITVAANRGLVDQIHALLLLETDVIAVIPKDSGLVTGPVVSAVEFSGDNGRSVISVKVLFELEAYEQLIGRSFSADGDVYTPY